MSLIDAARDLVLLEARLLDQGRFLEWADLFTDDALYWAPIDPAQTDPYAAPSHVLDDKQVILARAERLATPRTLSPEPAARTVHLVSNLVFEDVGDWPCDHRVSSAVICVEYRQRDFGDDDQRLFAATVSHGLRIVPAGEGAGIGEALKIVRKRVDLVNAAAAFNAVAVPI